MKKRSQKKNQFWQLVGRTVPYLAAFLVIFGVAQVGTEGKNKGSGSNLNISNMATSDYGVSADQLSELYVVANVADAMSLASLDTVSSNYVKATVMKEISQTSTDKLEKPPLINAGISRGVQTYVVKEGDTMESIATELGLTTDQIRWSNGLKDTTVTVGQSLTVPSIPGIVYTVKAGDTPDGLANKYGSMSDRIIANNDLESTGLVEGMQIVLPNGKLPLTERPEYVPPVYTYTFSGSSSTRQNVRVVTGEYNLGSMYGGGNPGTPGQCTWFAWWWRANNPNSLGRLPGGLGHAYSWAGSLANRGVSRTPAVGAVFQTNLGWYGHVGVVTAVNPDGSIVVREMNYAAPYVITEATIPASQVGAFNYIY